MDDTERRFGGLRRLYGDDGYARLRTLRLAVVGLGGVGSWVAEALARCGAHHGRVVSQWWKKLRRSWLPPINE